MMKFKNILITGGAGYVGTTLIGLLLENGFKVRVFDSLRVGGYGLMPYFSKQNFSFMDGDIRNGEQVDRALEDIDFIIHLAAIVGYPACRKEPELSRDINVSGTKNLIKHIAKKIPIFFASTGSTYGKMISKYCTETTPLNPLTDYGIQKAEAEKIVGLNDKFVIYRFATAFGVSPRMRLDLLPNDFTYRAVKEKTLIVYEKNFMRTFIHVRDMAKAILFALENFQKMNGEVYNVGDDRLNYSKEAICLLIKKKVDYYLHFAEVGHDLDQRDYIVSYQKINKIGYKTRISMEAGIDELIEACKAIDNPFLFSNV